MDFYRVLEHETINAFTVNIPFASESFGIYAAIFFYILHKSVFRHRGVGASGFYVHPAGVAVLTGKINNPAHKLFKLVDVTAQFFLIHLLCITSGKNPGMLGWKDRDIEVIE